MSLSKSDFKLGRTFPQAPIALLRTHSSLGSFSCPGVGTCTLPSAGKTLTMPKATITAEIHQPFDIHRNFTPTVTLDRIIVVNDLHEIGNILVIKIITVHIMSQFKLVKDLPCRGPTYTMDIGQRYLHVFVLG